MSFDQDPNEEVRMSGSDFAQMVAEIDRLKAELAETKGVCKYLVEAIEELPITTQYNAIGAEVMDTWLPIMKAILEASPEYRP